MKSSVLPEIFIMYPGYIRGVVVARKINNQHENPQLIELLREVERNATQDALLKDIKNHPRIANWRSAYSKFGINPNKYYSSIESLCRRARRGDQLPYINTAVALFNYFSLKHMVPSGGDDLASVKGDLSLTIAKGDEQFTPFNSDSVEYPSVEEIIYKDDLAVMCRCWNWRQGNQTKLTPETHDIAINVDCLPPVTEDLANSITSELADLVGKYCGGNIKYGLLTIRQTELEF
jgi:DNA/RNA-binding domain of Phe-tRNA-synthetase-like protein